MTYRLVRPRDSVVLAQRPPRRDFWIWLDFIWGLRTVALTMLVACRHDAPPTAAPGLHDDADSLQILDQAERTLAVAAGDCAVACRAVGDMRRATALLCRRSGDTCNAAQTRTTTASKEAAGTCGPCP